MKLPIEKGMVYKIFVFVKLLIESKIGKNCFDRFSFGPVFFIDLNRHIIVKKSFFMCLLPWVTLIEAVLACETWNKIKICLEAAYLISL